MIKEHRLYQLIRQKTPVEIHPADAEARGIASGDAVRVWNELGEVRVPARLNPDLQAGVVLLPKGMWSRHTLSDNTSGNTGNALVPDTFTDLGQGACFNDARVEVAKV